MWGFGSGSQVGLANTSGDPNLQQWLTYLNKIQPARGDGDCSYMDGVRGGRKLGF